MKKKRGGASSSLFLQRTAIVSQVSADVDSETGEEQEKRKMSSRALLALHDNGRGGEEEKRMKRFIFRLMV